MFLLLTQRYCDQNDGHPRGLYYRTPWEIDIWSMPGIRCTWTLTIGFPMPRSWLYDVGNQFVPPT